MIPQSCRDYRYVDARKLGITGYALPTKPRLNAVRPDLDRIDPAHERFIRIQLVAFISTDILIHQLNSLLSVGPQAYNTDGMLVKPYGIDQWKYSLLGWAFVNCDMNYRADDLQGYRNQPPSHIWATERSLCHAVWLEQFWQFFAWAATHPNLYTINEIHVILADLRAAIERTRGNDPDNPENIIDGGPPRNGLYLASPYMEPLSSEE